MTCPACGAQLSERKHADLTVNICAAGCGGIWFDNFELEKVDEAHESRGEALLDVSPHKPVAGDRAAKRSCPKCPAQRLQRHFFTVREAIEVDECPGCSGVWLDAGELVAIRKQFSSDAERTQAFNQHFKQLFAEELAEQRAKSKDDAARARKFAHALRFVCPSYWLSGKQQGGAF